MLEPMHPSIEPEAAAGRDQTARQEGQMSTDNDYASDELIIDREKVPLLQENLERIEEVFNVVVGLGLQAMEGVEKQWIAIQGLPEDRTMAKSYVKALCSPGKTLSFNFPDELHATLSHPEGHARLEKQSNTAILFPSLGQAVIQGEDDLAVTLAMSAIEDIIQKYHDIDIPDPSSPSATGGEATDRLDRELRRISNQNKELYGEEFDMETLTSLPGPVKRTLLKQYMDDSRQNSVEEPKSEEIYARDPDQTVPMKLAGGKSVAEFSESCFVDLHPTKKVEDKKASSAQAAAESAPVVDLHPSNNSLSLSLHLSDRDIDRKGVTIDLREASLPKSPSRDRTSPLGATHDTQHRAPMIDLTRDSPVPAQPVNASGLLTEAISFALNSGYSMEEIAVVEKDFGDHLTTAQFLQVLHTNRRVNTQKHALTVSELEATQIRRPKPQPTQTVVADSSESTDQEDHTDGKKAEAKQHKHQGHKQGPKMKKGKLSKETTPAKSGHNKKARARRNRRSPTEENIEKMEVVTLSDEDTPRTPPRGSGSLPKPIQKILQNSPHVGKKDEKHKDSADQNSARLMDYFQQLTKDYDEEDTNNIDEVRKRNTERRALLEQVLDMEKKRQRELENQIGENPQDEDGEDRSSAEWVTASRDGRHRFPKSPRTQEAEAQETGEGEAKGATAEIKEPDAGDETVVSRKQASRWDVPPPGGGDTGGGTIDALDDISLPPGINDDIEDNADGRVLNRGNYTYRGRGVMHHQNQTRGQYFKPNTRTLAHGPQHQEYIQQQHMQQQQQKQQQQQQQQQQKQLHHHFQQLQQQQPQPQGHPKEKNNLRYIVIDGSNVAMTHGNHQVFSCKGIRICIDYFRRRGHREITAFVPQTRSYNQRPDHPIRDQHMLEEMRQEGVLVFTPARKVPGKKIVCYDDKFVLRLAQETDGIIVSNDNYRDLWHEKREWRQIIEQRLLMFSFVGDIFMPPDDPLGRDGPMLDEFLRKVNIFEEQYRDAPAMRQNGADEGMPPYNRPNYNNGQQGNRPVWGRNQAQQYPGQGRPLQGGPYFKPGQQGQGVQQNAMRQPMRQPVGYNYNNEQRHTGQNAPNQGHFNQNAGGQGVPEKRPDTVTEWVRMKMFSIFPEKEAQIDQLLQDHPTEKDVNKLIELMLEVP